MRLRQLRLIRGSDFVIVLQEIGLLGSQGIRPVTHWSEMPDHLSLAAEELASEMRIGGVALFLGAGISRAAGLPDWSNLLMELAEDAILTEQVMALIRKRPLLVRPVRFSIKLGDAAADQTT